MSLLTLLLVVIAAIMHATWNLLAKTASAAGAPFVAAYSAISVIIYLPVAVWALFTYGLAMKPMTIACVVASGIVHLAYSLVLQRGYQVADLSVIYPVARGTGPLLAAIGAFLLLGEHATIGAILGLLTVVAGILLLASGGRLGVLADPAARPGVAWGTATGGFIATYTLVDGWGVKLLGINPIVLDWCANTVRLAFVLPGIVRNRVLIRQRMHGHWWRAAGVGVLAPLGYILVLTALRLGAPLHIVAPAREMSMMMGALLGMVFLGERVTGVRLAGCAMILGGVALLAI